MSKIPDFHNRRLLLQALTHRSYVNEHPEEGHNERLEYLGDAILSFLCAEYLYDSPSMEMAEDEMTQRRAALVNEKQLAKFATDLGLEFHMRLGKGVIQEGGFQNPNLLSSTFEALIGAYYLDRRGNNENAIEAVRAFIEPFFESVPETTTASKSFTDAKNRLQEWSQKQYEGLKPEYVIVSMTGPDHAKEFIVEVLVNGELLGKGKGTKKKEAEKALRTLRKQGCI
jgi:ribonuclease III